MDDQLPHLNDDHFSVIATGNQDEIANYALVLSAKEIDYFITDSGSSLMVPTDQALLAREQITQYQQENSNWHPVHEQPYYSTYPWPLFTFFVISCMALFFWFTGGWFAENMWFSLGAVNSEAILDNNQWWRLFTALTLHADLVHLFGNCATGACLILLLSRLLGYGFCWFLVLIAGGAGNLLNILLRQEQHLSVGFSTSIFAIIGIFTGLRLQLSAGISIKNILLPLGAGISLLAFLGGEGIRTDIGAHFFGFICGLFTGMVCEVARLNKKMATARRQNFFLSGFLILLMYSWFLALQSGNNILFQETVSP